MTIKEFILSRTIGPQRNATGDTTDRLLGSANNAARLRDAMARFAVLGAYQPKVGETSVAPD